ncbi:MAG: ribosome recycling factor [Bacilli bacterium]|nr:ribosome recycling factor [Bacilli bacterium]MDD3304824.1 ribosome recycling factor [Bacilli bacterium]MDD4053411.1 ribosome recycling factor [Bacilli bacterium]MDD4410942.1 ribosome recycling factor [Bacilli bacterium]
MDGVITQAEEKMLKALEAMEKRFMNVRAGRANPSVLDGIKVSYYGSDTPLIQLATISVPEARVLSIKPFDRSSIGNIEKAIFEANIGLTPNNNGETITLNFPALTEERRLEYVKQVKVMVEEARIVLRNIRQDSNNSIKKLELSEDEQDRGMEEVQNLINEYNKKIDEKLKAKEQELLTI